MPKRKLKRNIRIAIDGPVAAGKGSVARLVAERLGVLYIDTGAMYRAVALLAERAGIDWNDEPRLSQLASHISFEMRLPLPEEQDGRSCTVLASGEDVSWLIRTQHLAQGSSTVSKLQGVRRALVAQQQAIAHQTSVVMEGRDISYRVLPDAEVKVFLTASAEERARRRHQELRTREQVADLETVTQEVLKRDDQDSTRLVDPLTIVPEALVIDSTLLTIEQVAETILNEVRRVT